jgi:hypothetical protein
MCVFFIEKEKVLSKFEIALSKSNLQDYSK